MSTLEELKKIYEEANAADVEVFEASYHEGAIYAAKYNYYKALNED
jgi:hypothetical protein